MSHITLQRRLRLLSMYSTTLRILWSYALLHILRFVLGEAWLQRVSPRWHRKNAHRVQRTIIRLKGLFIKLGQLISILTNFLPEAFRDGLEELQDQVPPRPYEQIVRRIKDEFGQPPEQLFAEFDPTPVASASLAQVHRARLHDGRVVAVKVQHLDIEETARLDLKAIRNVFTLIGNLFNIRGLDGQYQQIRAMILEELDFTQEASYIGQIAANFEGNAAVGFPEVVDTYCSERVLTTLFIEGVKATSREALDALHIDRANLAQRIVEAYCQMIFVDGLYHADPHPGNIFIRSDGSVVFIDFGAVARLSPAMKDGIPQFLIGILRRDQDMVLKAVKEMGFISHRDNEEVAAELVDLFYERFVDQVPLDAINLGDINAESTMESHTEAWSDLQKLDISLRDLMSAFQVPRDWILLERTVLLLLGLCTQLDPNLNPMQIIRPYIEEAVLGPDKSWRQFAADALRDMARSAISIPDEMRRLLVRANRGELEVQIQSLPQSTAVLYALGQQFLFGLLTLGAGLLAFLGRQNQDIPFAIAAITAAVIFLLCLLGAMRKARKIQRMRKK